MPQADQEFHDDKGVALVTSVGLEPVQQRRLGRRSRKLPDDEQAPQRIRFECEQACLVVPLVRLTRVEPYQLEPQFEACKIQQESSRGFSERRDGARQECWWRRRRRG